MNPQPKINRIIDTDYTEYIKTLRCIYCGTAKTFDVDVVAAHQPVRLRVSSKGTAIKTHDIFTLPECHFCHIGLEHKGEIKIDDLHKKVFNQICAYLYAKNKTDVLFEINQQFLKHGVDQALIYAVERWEK